MREGVADPLMVKPLHGAVGHGICNAKTINDCLRTSILRFKTLLGELAKQ